MPRRVLWNDPRMNDLARLVTATSLPPSVRISEGRSALPRIDVSSAAARAEIYFQGAHVAAWQPAAIREPVLWMSERSHFEAGKPIRGGVPICFPWFGAHPANPAAPAHGFARVRDWRLIDVREDRDGVVALDLELAGEGLSPEWPHRFTAIHRIEVGPTLRMTLEVRNDGDGAFTFEEALHTYFDIADVRGVSVSGLEGCAYLDTMAGGQRVGPSGAPVRFTGETDRVYLETRDACVIDDPGKQRVITVGKRGSDATVVWNPWVAKALAMPDFGDHEWTGMLCVETGNVNVHTRTLQPGKSHAMTAIIEVRELNR